MRGSEPMCADWWENACREAPIPLLLVWNQPSMSRIALTMLLQSGRQASSSGGL